MRISCFCFFGESAMWRANWWTTSNIIMMTHRLNVGFEFYPWWWQKFLLRFWRWIYIGKWNWISGSWKVIHCLCSYTLCAFNTSLLLSNSQLWKLPPKSNFSWDCCIFLAWFLLMGLCWVLELNWWQLKSNCDLVPVPSISSLPTAFKQQRVPWFSMLSSPPVLEQCLVPKPSMPWAVSIFEWCPRFWSWKRIWDVK